ncbi:hypothetical protein BR93DRAFT_549529 [Coniochaeta sp. PMI_546]|nr:hypothetical protein BR93DRAFT_549529 [Coniochaeta sp. PMI_546]
MDLQRLLKAFATRTWRRTRSQRHLALRASYHAHKIVRVVLFYLRARGGIAVMTCSSSIVAVLFRNNKCLPVPALIIIIITPPLHLLASSIHVSVLSCGCDCNCDNMCSVAIVYTRTFIELQTCHHACCFLSISLPLLLPPRRV